MTRGEAYAFLVANATLMVERYTALYAACKNTPVTKEEHVIYKNKIKAILVKWEAALSLLNEEKSFHMKMLGD